jgi:hypothetical protein
VRCGIRMRSGVRPLPVSNVTGHRRPYTRLRPAAARGDERETPRLAREAAVRRSGHARLARNGELRRGCRLERDRKRTLT